MQPSSEVITRPHPSTLSEDMDMVGQTLLRLKDGKSTLDNDADQEQTILFGKGN